MKIIKKTYNGKITATNKQLEEFGLPDRFRKRTGVVIFGEPVDVGPRTGDNIANLMREKKEELVYIIGDCEDDEMKYYIPVEWVLIT